MKNKFKLQLGDELIFDNGNEIKTASFVFRGFSNGIHPFHRKEYEFTDEMLQSIGIIINRKEVPTVYDMGDHSDVFNENNIIIPDDLKKSSDGNTYYCLYDVEMGRGWCVLLKIHEDGTKEILSQDHRDNIREWMIKDWCKEMGVNVEITYN